MVLIPQRRLPHARTCAGISIGGRAAHDDLLAAKRGQLVAQRQMLGNRFRAVRRLFCLAASALSVETLDRLRAGFDLGAISAETDHIGLAERNGQEQEGQRRGEAGRRRSLLAVSRVFPSLLPSQKG